MKLFPIQINEHIKTVEIEFYLKDNRRRDLTNMAESVMDLLVDCGIIPDDSWQNIPRILLSAVCIRKDNPTAEVTIIY